MLVQCRRKAKDGDKEIEVPDIEAKCVFHDGQERPWNMPEEVQVETYLAATARDLFAGTCPEEKKLNFNAKTAAERVREKLKEKDKPAAGGDAAGVQNKTRKQRAARSA